MVRNSKTFGKSEAKRDFNPVPKVFLLENEKTLGMRMRERSWLQTSRWPQILKWPPKRTHFRHRWSKLSLCSCYVFVGFQNSLCYFHFYPTFEIEAAWMSNDKKSARCRRVWAVWSRIQGYSSPPCWEALKNVAYNNRRFCYLMIC